MSAMLDILLEETHQLTEEALGITKSHCYAEAGGGSIFIDCAHWLD